RTRSGIPPRRTCSTAGPTSAPCKNCWATRASRRPRSTHMCRPSDSRSRTGSPTRAPESADVVKARAALPGIREAGRMDTVLFFAFAAAYLGLLAWGVALAVRHGWATPANLPLLVVAGLVYDNVVIATGRWIGEGALLE